MTKPALLLLAALTGCATTHERKPTMAIDDNEKAVRTLYETCINTGRLDLLPTVISPDYQSPQGERGVAGFQSTLGGLLTAFPDIHYTLEEVITSGDTVVVRWKWSATHSGQFKTFAPTQKTVTNTAIAIHQLRDGRITNVTMESDRLGFLVQMGAVPATLLPPR